MTKHLSYEEGRQRGRFLTSRAMKILHATRRGEAISKYGNECSQCGKRTVDKLMVVLESGHASWPEPVRGKTGRERYRWLDEHDFPPGFTLVCSQVCRTKLYNPTLPTELADTTRTTEDMIRVLDHYGVPQGAGNHVAARLLATARGYVGNRTVLAAAVRTRKERAGVSSAVPAALA